MLARTLLLIGFLAATAFCSPFVNGSFESPAGGPQQHILGPSDTYVTGWTTGSNTAGQMMIYSDSGQFGIPAGGGTYYVSFGHNATTGGTLFQTFDTAIGQSYNISFLLTTQQGDAASFPQAMKAEALNGLSVLGSFQTLSLTNPNGVWTGNSFSFTATGTSSTLRFTDLTTLSNSASGVNWGLDSISVALASPVPEPSSALLIGSSFALLTIALRRNKAQDARDLTC
jgi:Protein of unknown function (DUF642)